MAAINLTSGTSVLKSETARGTAPERFASVKNVNDLFFHESGSRGKVIRSSQIFAVKSSKISEQIRFSNDNNRNLSSVNDPVTSVSY